MDTFKEIFVSLSNDRWLTRGVAVLAVDGPGQAESLILGSRVSVPNFIEAGKAIVDFALAARKSMRTVLVSSATVSDLSRRR